MVTSTKKVRFGSQTRDNAPWTSEPGRFYICHACPTGYIGYWFKAEDMRAAIQHARKRFDPNARANDTLSVVREGGGEYFFGQYE